MQFIETLGLQQSDFTDMVDAAKVDYPGWSTGEVNDALQDKIRDLYMSNLSALSAELDTRQAIRMRDPEAVAQAIIDMAKVITGLVCLTAQAPPPDFMDDFMTGLDEIAQDLVCDTEGGKNPDITGVGDADSDITL